MEDLIHSRCSVNVSVHTQQVWGRGCSFGKFFFFFKSEYLLLALFSFFLLLLDNFGIYMVIKAYSVFFSECILINFSYQISRCSWCFIAISFLKSKFYMFVSYHETFYSHLVVNELIYIYVRLFCWEVFKVQRQWIVIWSFSGRSWKGQTKSLVEIIRGFYGDIFSDLTGPELTLVNLRGSVLQYCH